MCFLNLDLHPSEWLLCCSIFFLPNQWTASTKTLNYNVWRKTDSRENHVHSEISFKIDGGNSSKSTKWTPWGRYTKMKKKTKFKWNAKKRIKTWQPPNKTNKKLPLLPLGEVSSLKLVNEKKPLEMDGWKIIYFPFLGGGNSDILYFHPHLGKWRSYFSNGLKPPTSFGFRPSFPGTVKIFRPVSNWWIHSSG